MGKTRISAAQINSLAGDVEGNAGIIFECAKKAFQSGASVLVTPGLSLSGAALGDMAGRPEFLSRCRSVLESLAGDLAAFPGLTTVVGVPEQEGGRVVGSAALLGGGRLLATTVGMNARREPLVLHCGEHDFRILAEEDPAPESCAGPVISIHASPFFRGKGASWEAGLRGASRALPRLCVNAVGGEDSWVFDGGSFAAGPQGEVTVRLPEFRECQETISYGGQVFSADDGGSPVARLPEMPALYEALVLALRDYVGKNRFPGVLLGLSGGVDSALVACLAADALGAEKVRAVMMPTRYTSSMSLEDAQALARALGISYEVVPIGEVFNGYMCLLEPLFEGKPWDATEENLQARIRGMILMALSNKTGSLVLTTGNKSESAVGYSTLYGDTAGGFAVLGDVLKTSVYELCRMRNRLRGDIPERILTRAPSAELREDQKDQDSLPEYAVLDEVIRLYVEEREAPERIASLPGMNPQTVWRIIGMIHRAEYKRRQCPIAPKVTPVSFGSDWRYPVTGRFR